MSQHPFHHKLHLCIFQAGLPNPTERAELVWAPRLRSVGGFAQIDRYMYTAQAGEGFRSKWRFNQV